MHRLAGIDSGVGDRLPEYVLGFGALLTLVLCGEIGVLLAAGSTVGLDGVFLIGVVTTLPFLAGISFGGYWLRDADLSPSRYPRIAGWILGSALVFLLINVALIAVMPPESWALVVGWLRWAVALGAGVGLLIGCIEARAIERSLAAERAALRAAHLEEQRDYLDYLNTVLRHEVLNAATVINGYASLLRREAATTDQHREWAEIVMDESDEMATVIDDVRVLLRTTDGEWTVEPVDVSRVLRDELQKLEHRRGPVDLETSIPPAVYVRANELVARVFGNLLVNAVEHNDAERPRVSVTVEPGPDTVRIEIVDNGPGIPDAEVDALFDRIEGRGSSHGLGLYLVQQLVTGFDGSVELVETGSDGSVFAVELPAATADRSSSDSEPAPAVEN
ncbi:sensor histidine kinase [Halopiger xanaduensis]|uniref:histidine kinase n=1 Tax=Halopiger xanaduensis (strain DSM 18323 / JCM 14033 / SH-6) TaxID=797210 RepID=F8D7H5_HALXS|nr:HAMP domain-containing sensor histidine kinase [Halopiger xanaduensis]AEH36149.1 integral membrane sensor signal transduction histidine kinase [Halopiger xanaduensis SH-6]